MFAASVPAVGVATFVILLLLAEIVDVVPAKVTVALAAERVVVVALEKLTVVPVTVRLSAIVVVPPVESIVRFPEDVSI